VPDLDHNDAGLDVVDGAQHTIRALPDTEILLPGELLAARRSQILGEVLDASDNANAVFARQDFEFLCGRRLDEQPVACHAA
jgi:hypothetical protein